MTPPASLREHVTPIAAETHVVAARWLKQGLALALADGRVLRWRDGATDIVEAHAGGILCATGDGERLISGGDDGRVVATRIEGAPEELAQDPKRRWIDAITLSPRATLPGTPARPCRLATRRAVSVRWRRRARRRASSSHRRAIDSPSPR